MTVHLPGTVEEAVDHLAALPSSTVLAGGTDLMVEVNDGHRRPSEVVVVNRIPELRSWRYDPRTATVTIGSAVTYSEMLDRFVDSRGQMDGHDARLYKTSRSPA